MVQCSFGTPGAGSRKGFIIKEKETGLRRKRSEETGSNEWKTGNHSRGINIKYCSLFKLGNRIVKKILEVSTRNVPEGGS